MVEVRLHIARGQQGPPPPAYLSWYSSCSEHFYEHCPLWPCDCAVPSPAAGDSQASCDPTLSSHGDMVPQGSPSSLSAQAPAPIPYPGSARDLAPRRPHRKVEGHVCGDHADNYETVSGSVLFTFVSLPAGLASADICSIEPLDLSPHSISRGGRKAFYWH